MKTIGGKHMELFGMLIFYGIGLLFLYLVIEAAIRNGINNSLIGKYLEKKHGLKKDEYHSPLDSPPNQEVKS